MFPLYSHISENYWIFPEVTDDVITISGPCKSQIFNLRKNNNRTLPEKSIIFWDMRLQSKRDGKVCFRISLPSFEKIFSQRFLPRYPKLKTGRPNYETESLDGFFKLLKNHWYDLPWSFPVNFRSNFRPKFYFRKFLLNQKLRLEISEGVLADKSRLNTWAG